MLKYSDSRIDIAKQTLLCGHCILKLKIVSPISPAELWCVPSAIDSLVIENLPNIYVIGNQERFESSVVNINGCNITIVLLPDFSKTGTCCFVNPKTFECRPFTFDSAELSR